MSQPWVDHKVGLFEDLRDPEFEIEYLNAALEDDDPRVFLVALRNVAEARGVSQVARDAQLNRENLYRMLSPNGNPQLSSLTALLRSIGLRLAIQPDQAYNQSSGAVAVAEEPAEYDTEDENDE
ncbi:MAG: putative addiction module antidote protein [Anaerolineae bacterium]|jgi:probable addiction module antidote protein|nr:putative addiction module antidote protein [Anaerolineae bacterium]